MSKETTWFVQYHKYSTKTSLDKMALKKFKVDCQLMSHLGVRNIILIHYPKGLHFGAYTEPWSNETLSGMIEIMEKYSMNLIPYFNPIEVSERVLAKHPQWRYKKKGEPIKAFRTFNVGSKEYYWRPFRMQTYFVCPATGWSDYLLQQIEEFLRRYPCGGIYLDQDKWAFECDEHSIQENMEALVKFNKKAKEKARKYSKGKVIINDYFFCRPPGNVVNPKEPKGKILAKDYKKLGKKILDCADIILVETDPFWNRKKTIKIIERIKKLNKPIIFFCHWDDWKGFAGLEWSDKITNETKIDRCYFFPFPVAETLKQTKNVIDRLMKTKLRRRE